MRACGHLCWLALLVAVACDRGPVGPPVHSGTLSFREVRVGSLVGGRVAKVAVAEGAPVEAGALLVELDPAEWQAALAEAQAGLAARAQQLAVLEAGTRPEQLAAAAAEARRLELLYEVSKRGARPEEVAAARQRLQQLEATAKDTGLRLERAAMLVREGTVPKEQLDSARARHDEASAAAAAQRQQLKLLEAGLRPEEVEATRQSFLAAGARLAELKAGPRPQELERARAEVAAARAQVQRARTRLAELTIRAPAAALVQTLGVREGDLVGAGRPVAVLLLREAPWVTIHVPQGRLAEVRLGQAATVTVDGLSAPLEGHVSWISRTAEFTPRNVQTRDERVALVFAVRVTLDDPPAALKDGQWADVVLGPTGP